jgi:NTE family protein
MEAAMSGTRKADLVLEGGGVKGIGLAGAVITLADAGYTFPRVAGTSAGAICAALVAALQQAGQPLSKLSEYLKGLDYPRFMAKSALRSAFGVAGDATSLLFHHGLYESGYLVEWLGGILHELGVERFGDLRLDDPGADTNWTALQRYSLVVHTADITRGRAVRLPWDFPMYGKDADSERIVDAVRASMSIPFFFEPIRFDAPQVRLTDGRSCAAGAVTWVDGGLLDNFPLDVFDRTDGAPSRWPTLGVKLSARETTVVNANRAGNLVEEAIACLRTMLDNGDRFYVPPDKQVNTIFVDSAGVDATNFHLSAADQQRLFESGTQAARDWLAAEDTRAASAAAGIPDQREATAAPPASPPVAGNSPIS